MNSQNEDRNSQLEEENSKLGLIVLVLLVVGIPLGAIVAKMLGY